MILIKMGLFFKKSPFIENIFRYLTCKYNCMDKRISTLIFIFVIYFIIAVSMLLFVPAQKFLTGLFFSFTGILLFFTFFSLWLLHRED